MVNIRGGSSWDKSVQAKLSFVTNGFVIKH